FSTFLLSSVCSRSFSLFSPSPLPHRALHSFPTRRSSDLHAIRIFFNRTEGTAERHNDGAQFALYTSDVYKAELDEPLRVDGQHSSEILVWLDLQRSLRFNSDTNESYYRLYSPGIYAYSQNAGHIHGTITTQRWANLNCPTPQYGKHNQLFGAYAYIYRNQ